MASPLTRGQAVIERLSSDTSSSLSTLLSRHVLSLTFDLFPPILRPRRNTWRVSTEVRPPSPVVLIRCSLATVHILRRSTSSTMNHFFTHFISTDHPSLMETRIMVTVSQEGRDGTANYGGTNSHTFAGDGEASYLGPHPTWVFASSVHMARQLQTCWHIHLPFHSSSIT